MSGSMTTTLTNTKVICYMTEDLKTKKNFTVTVKNMTREVSHYWCFVEFQVHEHQTWKTGFVCLSPEVRLDISNNQLS